MDCNRARNHLREEIAMAHQLFVIGDPQFVRRHRGLFAEIERHGYLIRLIEVPVHSSRFRAVVVLSRLMQGVMRRLGMEAIGGYCFQRNSRVFAARSAFASRQLLALGGDNIEDVVLQVFCQFSSFGSARSVRKVMLCDYTMAMAVRRWPPWSWYPTVRSIDRWLDRERSTFFECKRIFAMSDAVRRSLVDDYGVPAERVVVVGSAPQNSGNSRVRRLSDRPVRSVVFNGSDFARKGGDMVIQAFDRIVDVLPECELNIVGIDSRGGAQQRRVVYHGNVSADEMGRLFENATVVVAPARCDPYPTFLVEAQCAGIPVICSDVDGQAEIVADGVTGVVLDLSEDGVELLASRLISILSDDALYEQMSRASAERAARVFSWPGIAHEMVKQF